MNSSKPRQLHVKEVQFQTVCNRDRIKHLTNLVNKYKKDPEKDLRLKNQECVICYYSSGISGQAFTSWTCLACQQEFQHSNTRVPRLCRACAEVTRLCQQCGADLELKDRDSLL